MSELDRSKYEPTIKAGDLVCFQQQSHCGIIYKVIEVREEPFSHRIKKFKDELDFQFQERISKLKSENDKRWGRKFRVVYVPVFTLFKQQFSGTKKSMTANGNTDFGMTKLSKAALLQQLAALRQFIYDEACVDNVG